MKFRFAAVVVAAAAASAATPLWAQDAGSLNVICSVQAEWCNMIQTVFAKSTGIKLNMSLKGSGEALAQLIAERANPKTDVWFGGTGDPHLAGGRGEPEPSRTGQQGARRTCIALGAAAVHGSRRSAPIGVYAGIARLRATTPNSSPRRTCRSPRAGPTS